MVSVNPNPGQGFYLFENPTNTGLPGLDSISPPQPPGRPSAAESGSPVSFGAEEQSKKIRKPYTITKSRESWTEEEHDKFLEALQLFDRDWKKIEAFIGSKTVIQIRSHAQKYFLKVQKSGAGEHVPPPRPKRKAAHPYPQKAPKSAPVISQLPGTFQSLSVPLEPRYIYAPDSSSDITNSVVNNGVLPTWVCNSDPSVSLPLVKDEAVLAGPMVAHNSCYSNSSECLPAAWQTSEPPRDAVMPDFGQVYSFIGSIFDQNSRGHSERLKDMDPINLETASQLMKNLSINLASPEFEDHESVGDYSEQQETRAEAKRSAI